MKELLLYQGNVETLFVLEGVKPFVLCTCLVYNQGLMNSMVLTSGEVTGLSQDRVSKQDAVAGKHRSKCCDELIPQ